MSRLFFPLFGFACLAVSALLPTASFAAVPQVIGYGFGLMADASPAVALPEPLRLAARPMALMRVPGMPSAERSGASASMLNGPILSPVRGFEIAPTRC